MGKENKRGDRIYEYCQECCGWSCAKRVDICVMMCGAVYSALLVSR